MMGNVPYDPIGSCDLMCNDNIQRETLKSHVDEIKSTLRDIENIIDSIGISLRGIKSEPMDMKEPEAGCLMQDLANINHRTKIISDAVSSIQNLIV